MRDRTGPMALAWWEAQHEYWEGRRLCLCGMWKGKGDRRGELG